MIRKTTLLCHTCLSAMLFGFAAHAQQDPAETLRTRLHTITASAEATVGVGVLHLERGDTLTLNRAVKFPMQSVYKLPLAMTVFHLVDNHTLDLSQTVHLGKEDVAPETWSPLKKKYPEGNVDVTVADLLFYTVSASDNIGCDLLFRLVGGPATVNQYLHDRGFTKIHVVSTEAEMHTNENEQYRNWSDPMEMCRLLEALHRGKLLSDASSYHLLRLMRETSTGPMRIRGMLPPDVEVAHKTGTGGTDDKGTRSACNDVGIITLPDGTHVALSVFITRSAQAFESDEKLIALIARTVYEHFSGTPLVYFERNKWVSGPGQDILPYRLLGPSGENPGEKYPLVVYLHGSASKGNDNEIPLAQLPPAFTDPVNRQNHPCYVLVPQCPATDAWVLFPGFPKSITTTEAPTVAARQVLELIHALVEAKNIDPGRIYLTGYSLGGEGTFDLLRREPGLFACGVPLAAVADTATASAIRHIPLWAFHGSEDPVNEVKYTRWMIAAMQQAGGTPKYTELQGAGHNITRAVYSDPELWQWIFEQKRNKDE